MNSIPPIQSLPPVNIAHAGHVPRESREQELRIDQVVRATIEEDGQTQVWLNIKGERLPVVSEVPLPVGEQLTLVVAQLEPRLEFQVVGDALGQHIRQGLALLNEPWPFGQLPAFEGYSDPAFLAQFAALQAQVVQGGEGRSLTRLLGMLGLDLESKLLRGKGSHLDKSLKELLLKHASDKGDLSQENLPKLFDLLQLIRLKLAGQGLEFWPLPLPGNGPAFLYAEGAGEEVSGENDELRHPSWRITVNLDLANLGAMQIDFLWESSGLLLRFRCAGQDQANFLAAAGDELRSAVTALPLERVGFVGGAEAPASALVRRLISDGVLDERI